MSFEGESLPLPATAAKDLRRFPSPLLAVGGLTVPRNAPSKSSQRIRCGVLCLTLTFELMPAATACKVAVHRCPKRERSHIFDEHSRGGGLPPSSQLVAASCGAASLPLGAGLALASLWIPSSPSVTLAAGQRVRRDRLCRLGGQHGAGLSFALNHQEA